MSSSTDYDNRQLAAEQLLIALIFALEQRLPGLFQETVFMQGSARMNVDVDQSFRDLIQTIRLKANRAGIAL